MSVSKCKLMGHKWEGGRCVRCALECGHTHRENLDACTSRCTVCGLFDHHHDFQAAKRPGHYRCAVCGYTFFRAEEMESQNSHPD